MIAAVAALALALAVPALALVSHSTRTVVRAPSSVTAGGAIRLAVTIQSSAPHPAGTCFVQQQLAWRWATVARATTRTGACSVRLMLARPGTALLRVRFSGGPGWGSSTSKSLTVRVS
jgi:hypothetical protein